MDVTKIIAGVAASIAALGGGYTLADKFGWLDSDYRMETGTF